MSMWSEAFLKINFEYYKYRSIIWKTYVAIHIYSVLWTFSDISNIFYTKWTEMLLSVSSPLCKFIGFGFESAILGRIDSQKFNYNQPTFVHFFCSKRPNCSLFSVVSMKPLYFYQGCSLRNEICIIGCAIACEIQNVWTEFALNPWLPKISHN